MDFKKRPTFNGSNLALTSEVGTAFPGFGAGLPAGLGTAATGSDATASRSDHVHSSTVAGTLAATAVRVNDNVVTRVFTVTFGDGVANQKVDLTFGSFAGELDVTVAAYYTTANAAGSLTKRFAGYWQDSAGTPVYHMARAHYTDALGNTPDHFAISPAIGWTGSAFKVTVAHRTSTGNSITIVVHARAAPGFGTAIADAALGAVYTTDTTVYDAPQVYYDTGFRFSGGYGAVASASAGSNAVVVGGGGGSPNSGSVCWGDGSGWQLTFGPSITGTYTPRIFFSDKGKIGVGAAASSNGMLDGACTKNYTASPFSGDIPLMSRNIDTTDNNWSELAFRGSGTAISAGIATRLIDHANNYGEMSLWTRSAGGMTSKLNISSTGPVTIPGSLGLGAATAPAKLLHLYHATSGARLYAQTASTSDQPGVEFAFDATSTREVLITGRATGSLGAELAFFTKPDSASAATERLTLDAAGKLVTGKVQTGAAPGGTAAMASVVNATAAEYGLLIRGAASQSENLTCWQNSAGTTLARVDADGDLFLPTTSFAVAGTSVPGDDAAAGSATTFSRSDHVHAREEVVQALATRYASTTATNTITATSFAALPNSISVSITVATATWVLLNYSAWMVCNGSTGDVRASIDISGDTTMGPIPPTEPDGTSLDNFGWGEVLFLSTADSPGGSSQRSATRFVEINSGTTTFTFHAYKTNTPTNVQVNYPSIRVTTLRYG